MLTLHSVEDIPVDRHTHISCEAKRLHSELARVCLEDISHIVAFLKLSRACCNTELKQVLSSRDSLRRALVFLKTTPLRPVQSPMFGFVSFCILPENQNSTVSKRLTQKVTGQERVLKKPDFWRLRFFHNTVRTSLIKDTSRNSDQTKRRQV